MAAATGRKRRLRCSLCMTVEARWLRGLTRLVCGQGGGGVEIVAALGLARNEVRSTAAKGDGASDGRLMELPRGWEKRKGKSPLWRRCRGMVRRSSDGSMEEEVASGYVRDDDRKEQISHKTTISQHTQQSKLRSYKRWFRVSLYSIFLLAGQSTATLLLSFDKVIKRETFSAVLDMQFYPSLTATCAFVAELFASGEWETLEKEMNEHEKGRVSYIMTLVWIAVTWQISSIVIFFHDEINGVKVVVLLLAIWGLSSLYLSTLSR